VFEPVVDSVVSDFFHFNFYVNFLLHIGVEYVIIGIMHNVGG